MLVFFPLMHPLRLLKRADAEGSLSPDLLRQTVEAQTTHDGGAPSCLR